MSIKTLLEQRTEAWCSIGSKDIWQEFLLRNGQEFEGRAFDGDMMEPHNCFQNALEYALAHDMDYVEGVIIRGDFPVFIHHAWAIDDDGSVYDPTLQRPEECHYIGIVLDMSTVLEEIRKNEVYGLFVIDEMYNVDFMKRIDASVAMMAAA